MGLNLDVSEARAVASRIGTSGGRIGAVASQLLRKTTFDIVADGQAFSEVDTGTQRASIGADFTGDGRSGLMTAEAGPTTEYSPFREFGTSVAAAHPFMGPAYDRNIGPYTQGLAVLAAREVL